MFGTIRKHQTWLWAFIITAMILGLVIYFSPNASTGGRDTGKVNFGSIDGVPIKQKDFVNAQREAYLAYFVATGTWPDSNPKSGFDVQRETYQRLFFLQKLQQQNIHVDSDSVARMANNILTQLGNGRPVPLENFVQQVLAPRGATVEDFERYVRHQLGLQQLISVVGIGGDLVTPQEAQALYIRENQEVATSVVFFSGTNYQTSVTPPTPQGLGEFYTNQMAAYRLPERVQVSYVAFEATNFHAAADLELAKNTNLNLIVQQIYLQRGTNFYREAKSPEEARQKIRAEIRHEQALSLARRKADEFASVLFDREPMRAGHLADLARTNGLVVKTTAAFDVQGGLKDFDGGADFARKAFRLTDDEPFAGPLVGEDGVYVIALARRIPSEVPALDTLRERVTADYKRFQAAVNARRAGGDFVSTLTNGLAAGKTFAGICSDAKVKTLALPPVSLSTRELPLLGNRVSLPQFQRIALETEPGKASEFIPTADGGFIVYVQNRLPLDQARMSADMPEFLKLVRQSRRQEAINAWLQREGSKSLRDTPLMQEKPSLLPQRRS